jgi:hypothetical protein
MTIDKPQLKQRIGRAKAVTKEEQFQTGTPEWQAPRSFAVVIRVFPMVGQTGNFPRLFPLMLSVPNSVVTRRSLDKFCLEKRQTRSGWVMNQAERDSNISANRESKRIVVPITEKRPTGNEASRVRELARKFRHQNMENLCGT